MFWYNYDEIEKDQQPTCEETEGTPYLPIRRAKRAKKRHTTANN